MKFVFWQDIISIHQSAFLKALSKYNEVILVVEKINQEERIQEGWDTPDIGNTRIYVSPSDKHIFNLLNGNLIHIFSGIDAIPMVYEVFKIATVKKLNIAVMLEPFEWFGVKGLLRRIKYRYLYFKYGENIDYVLVTGTKAMDLYKNSGFPNKKLFDWGYFTKEPDNKKEISNSVSKPSVLFVGRLDQNKNILALIRSCKIYQNFIDHLCIIGDGPLNKKISKISKSYHFIHLKGTMSNREVRKLMNKYDILVLPSKYDGWGAVINEALQAGMQVIASENCGSGVLLDGNIRGEVFSFSGKNNLQFVLKKWLEKGPLTKDKRIQISEWSQKSISGSAAAKYFVDISKHMTNPNLPKPIAPWM